MAATRSHETEIRRASHLMRAGQFIEAKEQLESLPSTIPVVIEQMRVCLRLSQFKGVLKLLRVVLASAAATDTQRTLARAMCYCARASLRLQRTDFTIDESFLGKGDEGAELSYFLALEAWVRGSYDAAERIASKASPQSATARAQHLILYAMICKAQERFWDQASACKDALNILISKAPDETYYISAALLQYCFLARELPLHESSTIISVALNRVAGLPAAKLQALRALGWSKVISGDYVGGMQAYSGARDLAGDFVSKVLTHLDYANAACWSGSKAAAAAEYHYASELMQRISWRNVVDESPVTLLIAAQVGAGIDHSTARTHLNFAKGLKDKISPAFALAHGRRWSALYSEASALVMAAHNEFFEAQRQASAACEDFSRMGYSWRAGRMALLMYQLSGKSYWRDRARTLLAEYPNSVFAKQVGIEPGEVRLTRRQEQVLEFLRRGYKSEAIAAELNMARNTVHTHITAIHRAYGVQRRSELLAKLAGTV